MAGRLEQARALAADLAVLTGVDIHPDPPQAPIFNVIIDGSPEALDRARHQIAVKDDVWLFDRMWPTDAPDRTRIEIEVGRQVADFTDGEIVALVHRLQAVAGTG